MTKNFISILSFVVLFFLFKHAEEKEKRKKLEEEILAAKVEIHTLKNDLATADEKLGKKVGISMLNSKHLFVNADHMCSKTISTV